MTNDTRDTGESCPGLAPRPGPALWLSHLARFDGSGLDTVPLAGLAATTAGLRPEVRGVGGVSLRLYESLGWAAKKGNVGGVKL